MRYKYKIKGLESLEIVGILSRKLWHIYYYIRVQIKKMSSGLIN